MRLDFNVLWVDDQQNLVTSTKDRIEYLVRKEGFRLQVQFAESIEKAKLFLSNDIYGDHIDLILMDYDLGAGGKGDDGLVEVRNIFEYKDVIFYSAHASSLPALVAEKQLQGIFCSTRDTLHETVLGVFDSLMKKVLDIDHSRGIVMGATSDIDHLIVGCLSSTFEHGCEDNRLHAFQTVERHLEEKSKKFAKDTAKIAAIKHISELLDFHHTYTSNDRMRLLTALFERDGRFSEAVNSIKEYLEKTVPRRNDLAHLRVEANGFSRKLFNRKGEELTQQEMRELRLALLNFQEIIEVLMSEIGISKLN